MERPFKAHLLEKSLLTGIHFLVIVFIYILMYAVMTYNLWVIFSIVLGNALGYFIFALSGKDRRNTEVIGCCHAG
jgi:hypothetical protein